MREPNVQLEFTWVVAKRKNEVFEADNVLSKWNAMKEVLQKAAESQMF